MSKNKRHCKPLYEPNRSTKDKRAFGKQYRAKRKYLDSLGMYDTHIVPAVFLHDLDEYFSW